MTILRAARLTTCSVAADGTGVALGVAEADGRETALVLPTECLQALVLTLPDLMRRALRLLHHDPGLRLVYPAAGWEVEESTQPGTLILTLRTADNFHVSFSVTAADLQEIAEAVPSRGDEGRPTGCRPANVH